MKNSKKNLYSQYKLMKHLDKVISWEETGFTYPVMVDFDLTNKCNHCCPQCNSIQNRNNATISFNNAKNIISQLKEVDVKAIGFAGGGEPSCNPDLKIYKSLRIFLN